MKIKPLSDRVLLKRIEEKEVARGGIIIPDTAKEKPQKGLIRAVGPGKKNEEGIVVPVAIEAGEKVLFSKYAGTEFKLEDEDLLVLREDDILGVIED